MKKSAYMFLLVGSLLIGANVVNAAGDGAKKNKAKTRFVTCAEQTDQIKALIGNPDMLVDNAASVVVNFNISADNIVTVNEIRTDNTSLEKFIFSKMNGARIRSNDVEMKNQTIVLTFKQVKEEYFIVY